MQPYQRVRRASSHSVSQQYEQEEPVLTSRSLPSESSFDGKVLQLIGVQILAALLTTVTLGFAFPWAVCLKYRWEAKHTAINGQRLEFTGTGGGLFVSWLLITLPFAIVSAIVYFLAFDVFYYNDAPLLLPFIVPIPLTLFIAWASVQLKRWRIQNTKFRGE